MVFNKKYIGLHGLIACPRWIVFFGQGHLRGGERRDELGWELTPDEMAWLQSEGALSGAQQGRGCIDVEEEKRFQEMLELIPRKVWPKEYWGKPFVQQYRDM